MQIFRIILLLTLTAPGVSLAQIVCAPVDAITDLGQIPASTGIVDRQIQISVSCENRGAESASGAVLVSLSDIDNGHRLFSYDASSELPLRFVSVLDPRVSLIEQIACRDVNLRSGQILDVRISVRFQLRVRGARAARYEATIPFVLEFQSCEERGRCC